jgi:sulfonate transport system ATP-binding protein
MTLTSFASPTTAGARSPQPVTLRGVSRTFTTPTGRRPVLAGVDLELAAGEIVALIGPSGCGKSTLLRLASGLDKPDSGKILINGLTTRGIDHRCAVAFQEPRLLPWRTLSQNVALGLPRGTPKEVGTRRVAELLSLVGLDVSAWCRPRQVSGGMAQRVSLARALARSPGVLLLDEPFGALDALTRLKMQDLLLKIHAAEPTTILLVTHDVEEALYLADRVVLLGTPDRQEPRSIRNVITVPGQRPRDRASVELAGLRAVLLEGLGVATHHTVDDHPADRPTGTTLTTESQR